MVQITFTDNLARHLQLTPLQLPEAPLGTLLVQLFATYPALRSYLIDEQQRLRPHILMALDAELIQGRLEEHQARTGFSRLHIMQALSGG